MAITLGNSDTVLTSTAAEVMGAGAAEQLLILKAAVNNQDAAAQTVSVYRVGVSGTAGVTNLMVDALTLQPGETKTLPLSGQPVINGESLQASCSASGNMVMNVGWVVVA